MFTLDDNQIKEFICNETSSFALSVIDLENAEVIYTNNAMKNIIMNKNANKCWEMIYDKKEACSWCKIKDILAVPNKSNGTNIKDFEYEYFNELTNSWYQIQNKITSLDDGKNILISIAIDISKQKKSQGDLIATQVKLVRQTQELEEVQKELKLLASQDYLTKLYNRRYFTETSVLITDLAKRNNTDTSIMMIDIDKFKTINDTYGHSIGDESIISLSKTLQKETRTSDVLCRWGGEEFIVLLPCTNLSGASVLAEKIRQSVEKITLNFKNDIKIQFTISIGITQIDKERNTNIDYAINKADKALYEAKKSGRNKIIIFTEND